MKKVPCSYHKCGEYRVHYERPDEQRGQQMVEVPDNHEGKAYCSIACACLDGAMSMNEFKSKDHKVS